jgi:hypothetical protein
MKPIFSSGVYFPTYIIGEPIQKGNGIHLVHNGRTTEHRWYPEEALNDNPDKWEGMDAPPFAHSGHVDHEQSGHSGVGHLYDMEMKPGTFGGLMWDDGHGVHFHGIDAVINQLGLHLQKMSKQYPGAGFNPLDAQKIVQEGIDLDNERNGWDLPNVESKEWRKNVTGHYDKDDDRGHRAQDGRLVTSTTNMHGKNHAFGIYLESLSNPAYRGIADSLKKYHLDLGSSRTHAHSNTRNLRFLKVPHITAETSTYAKSADGRLVPRAIQTARDRDSHQQGVEKTPLDPYAIKQFKDITQNNAIFKDVTSYGIIPELANDYFLRKKKPQYGRGGRKPHGQDDSGLSIGKAKEGINRILHPDHQKEPDMNHIPHEGEIKSVDMNDPRWNSVMWTDFKTGKTHPLSEIFKTNNRAPAEGRNTQLFDDFIHDMAMYPFFEKMFGDNTDSNIRVKEDGTVTGSLHKKLDRYYENKYQGGFRKRNGEILSHDDLQSLMSHSDTHSTKIKNQIGGGDSLHTKAVRNYATILSSGLNANRKSGGPTSIHALDMLSGEELQAAGFKPGDLTGHENISQVRNIANALSTMMLESHGLEKHIAFPASAMELFTRNESNQSNNLRAQGHDVESIPEHAQKNFVGSVPKISSGFSRPTAAPPVVAPPPPPPVVTPPVVTPPPPVVAPPGGVAGQPPVLPSGQMTLNEFPSNPPIKAPTAEIIANNKVGVRPSLPPPNFRSLLPGPVAARQQASQTPEGTEQAMRNIANNPNLRITEEQRQRAQSAFADPQQSLLTDFQKAEKLIKMMEKLQLTDAFADENVLKHVPNNNLNKSSSIDVKFMAERLNVTSQDVRTILHAKGDWERIHKTYGYSDTIIKAVKVSFSGGLK